MIFKRFEYVDAGIVSRYADVVDVEEVEEVLFFVFREFVAVFNVLKE